MKYDFIIAGAGISGSTAARLLAEAGKKILVTEKNSHIAGHCHDRKNEHGISIHTYGPHIFHTNMKQVWDYVNRFSEFHYYQHKVLSYANGMLVPFPINRDTISELFGTYLSIEEVRPFLQHQVKKSRFDKPPKNFRDFVVSQVGEFLYETFFKNYTLKQWEKDPEELSPEIAKRIPIRENRDQRYFSDKYQGIPSNGYTALVKKMLDHKNITIRFNQDYFKIKNTLSGKSVIFTGELDRYFGFKYGTLEYRSLDLVFKTYDREYYQETGVINFPNDYDWTRITEFKYFLDEKTPKTTVCFEYPRATGRPYYVVMTDENLSKREKYMKEAAQLEAGGTCYFTGRLAEYKYYNMDQAIDAAMRKVKEILER